MSEVSNIAKRIRPQEALEALKIAFDSLRQAVNDHGFTTGDVRVTLDMSCRADGAGAAVCKLLFSHYSYSKYSSRTEAEGYEWLEVQAELLRQLDRDASLKRLTHQPAPE